MIKPSYIPIFLSSLILAGCASSGKLTSKRKLLFELSQHKTFASHHTGFTLYDLDQGEHIIHYNDDLLYTPASNMKLFTMYAALSSFHDSIPGILYQRNNKTLKVMPVGDPTFLASGFSNQRVFDFLKTPDSITIHFPVPMAKYGPGWAWDDYSFAFQAERSWWPIYKNLLTVVREGNQVSITPSYFTSAIDTAQELFDDRVISREPNENRFKSFFIGDEEGIEASIPFQYSDELLIRLLEDTLNIPITRDVSEIISPDTLQSQHLDSVLTKMLKPSDNFLAEQLLILAMWKNGFTTVQEYIQHLQETSLEQLSRMVWIDGSGLSRYNLVSPRDQVKLLIYCIHEFGWDRITQLLPKGGEGTLKDLYLSEEPFIFAKTGTLSNNHNLSGFLITRSGRRLVFSFMHNHYINPTIEIKEAMESFLVRIQENY